VFTLVGSQGRLKAEEDELSCVRAERERWELTTGGGAPWEGAQGEESPSLPYLALFEPPLPPPKTHTHTHTHTRISLSGVGGLHVSGPLARLGPELIEILSTEWAWQPRL